MTKIHKATCHCGAVELAVQFPDGIADVIRCDCSICRRKNARVVATAVENVTVVKGADKLTLYQFHTHVAKHYFCSICGIYTHHQRRVNPNQYSVNLGCIDALNP
ncbi:MAG: GFA family protein [Rhodobacteraceae bacterium]|nr:GFA family protein [Paracoccaceae bacterium]